MSILGPGRCDTCQWWGGERSHVDDQPWGRCRRSAPTAYQTRTLESPKEGVPSLNVLRADWLWTAFDDWCAEYQAKRS